MRQADIIVIGAGVLGTFHAYFAAQKGYTVLLIERNSLPSSASTRNFGMVVRTIVETDNEWAAYARDTAEIYRSIQREYDISLRSMGSLYLASTETRKGRPGRVRAALCRGLPLHLPGQTRDARSLSLRASILLFGRALLSRRSLRRAAPASQAAHSLRRTNRQSRIPAQYDDHRGYAKGQAIPVRDAPGKSTAQQR